jgi:excisionase family DNA binding protein
MSIAAAARLLGVERGTVRRAIASGTLNVVLLHPKASPRVRRDDVEALARGDESADEAAPS